MATFFRKIRISDIILCESCNIGLLGVSPVKIAIVAQRSDRQAKTTIYAVRPGGRSAAAQPKKKYIEWNNDKKMVRKVRTTKTEPYRT